MALITLINYLLDAEETSSFFTEMGISATIHRGTVTELGSAVVEYIERTGTDLNIDPEVLAELASESISGSMISIACCMVCWLRLNNRLLCMR